jgi:hypothetical protein
MFAECKIQSTHELHTAISWCCAPTTMWGTDVTNSPMVK